jgi:ribose transport system substrate-binding protein
MKKQILGVLLLFLIAGMLLGGCKKNVGTPEDNAVEEEESKVEDGEEEASGFLFGYSCIDMENPYFETLQLAIDTTVRENGHRLLTMNPGYDVDVQIEQIQEMIDQGVDAVFLCPVDWEKITPALNALKEAGIPVINIDTQVKDTDLVDAYIGSDNKNAGFLCGEDLIKQRPDGGKIVILESPSMNSVNDRITGFEEAIANAGFEVLTRADVGTQKDAAKSKMKDILEQYSYIDSVMCGNDQVALGVLEAIEDAGRGEILVYGVDGAPGVKAALEKPGTCMAGTGAQSPINIGKKAVETGIAVLEGKDYEKEIFVDTFFINKDNVEMYGTDGWQ